MLNERITDLIQADVDGELQDRDRAELESALNESAEARKLRDELGRVARVMSSVPHREPPHDLHRRLLESIALPSPPRFSLLRSWWDAPFSHALAVAAGVLLAVGLTHYGTNGTESVEDLVGTMVVDGNDVPGSASSVLKIDVPEVNGQIRLKPMDQAWVLEFDLASPETVDVAIDLGKAGFTFGGFASQDEAVQELEVSGGMVYLKNHGNHGFAVFLLADPVADPRPIQVAVNHQGSNVFQGVLESSGG